MANSSTKSDQDRDIKGVSVVGEEDARSSLWAGRIDIGSSLTNIVMPSQSWSYLSPYLVEEGILEIERVDTAQKVMVKIVNVSRECDGKEECLFSYSIDFSPEILPISQNRAKEMEFIFALPKLVN